MRITRCATNGSIIPKTGLDAQWAKVLLMPFGKRSEMVLLGFLLITGLFSMFVSNTANAAMMLTFLTPVFHQLPPEGKGRIAWAMSIPVAINLGGMGTPIGTPPNALAFATGYVKQNGMAKLGIISSRKTAISHRSRGRRSRRIQARYTSAHSCPGRWPHTRWWSPQAVPPSPPRCLREQR